MGITLLFGSAQGLGFAFEIINHGVIICGNLPIVSVLGIVFSIRFLSNSFLIGIS